MLMIHLSYLTNCIKRFGVVKCHFIVQTIILSGYGFGLSVEKIWYLFSVFYDNIPYTSCPRKKKEVKLALTSGSSSSHDIMQNTN